MTLRTWLTRLYPRAWRERYGDEFEALLDECLRSPLDVIDIFLGAIDAHLELPHVINWRLMNMVNKLRTTVLFVFAAYVAFIAAGFSLNGLVDDSPFVALTRSNTFLSAAWTAIEVGAVIGLLAIVVGGSPLAWTILRRAFTSQRKDLRLLAVPLISFLLLASYFVAIAIYANQTRLLDQADTALGRRLMWGLIAIFVIGAIASAVAVWKLISRTEVDQDTLGFFGKPTTVKLYEFAFPPAVIASVAMLLMFLATLAWGWTCYSLRPELFSGNMGVMRTSTSGSFAFTVLLMAAATFAAWLGVARGRTAVNRQAYS